MSALFIAIVIVSCLCARLVYIYADAAWRSYALCGLAGVVTLYVVYEIRGFVRFSRSAAGENRKTVHEEASALLLINEEADAIKSWDLRNRTGLLIGRSTGGADADIDLSDTAYFSLIGDEHAVLNHTSRGWLLADVGSRNGTALLRAGSDKRMILTPGEPIPIRPGDTIFIAGETALAVR
ncbi:MAG: FHA domain-containing protein [Clostridiales Family XIII bacterium]|nr:FHA domain-containing protein [Clostridiales Family XIII bacterium]